MKVSLNWLRRLLPGLRADVETVSRTLTSLGLEVEGIEDQAAPYGGLVRLLASRRRNVVVVADNAEAYAPPVRDRTIDIWWRGKQANAPFMLAVAYLVMRGDEWRGARLRICNIAEDAARAEDARRLLEGFLAGARVKAETVVIVPDGTRTPMERIRETSATSNLVLLGLRRPNADETDEAYGDYIRQTCAATASLPLVAFALASEDVDFQSIFA